MSDKNSNDLIHGRDYYIEHGLFIFTEHYLTQRGFCCNNGCRHCPYAGDKNIDANFNYNN